MRRRHCCPSEVVLSCNWRGSAVDRRRIAVQYQQQNVEEQQKRTVKGRLCAFLFLAEAKKMDESPAMKEHWESMMRLRNSEKARAALQWSKSKTSGGQDLTSSKNVNTMDLIQFLDSGRHNLAIALASVAQGFSNAHHPIQLHLKFVENLFKRVGKGLHSIGGPPMLASASTIALSTLPATISPSFWSHSLSGDKILLPQQSWTKDRSFDAFLDGRDVDALIWPQNERPDWVKEPAERTLALAEVVAENAVEGWSGFIRPVDKMWQISSSFGPRWGRHHNGVDLAAPTGEPILASDSGEVTFAGWDSGYGNLVEVTHRDGWKTLYAHNSEIFTWEGQFVRRGECIALVGETGQATGPHLHWEIRNKSGKPVDPCSHVEL